jgi:light-regulated signal transduction histidine kinase (bacteriophytochrome)
LAYSRVGSQGKPLQPVDAGAVLDEVLHVLQATVQRTGATVLAQGLPTVLADPDQLHQLFMNLVGNALKFRGDAAPCVTVQASAAHGLWTFRVADNGIGIEPQFAERIFQMFQRLHDRERYEGSGIGLAISRRILERHGGRIWLDTDAVPGSTFCFTLPALTPPD